MRVLVYAFGPYGHFQENVTEKILRQLPKRKLLKRVVFPVRFHKRQFTSTIKTFNPDVILGLGQCSNGRFLRVETTAVNKRRNKKTERAKAIVASGAKRLLTNLKLNLGAQARFSHSAGDYVCNYSMYVVLEFLKRRRLSIPFGFVHIPHDYDQRKAVRWLLKAMDDMRPAE